MRIIAEYAKKAAGLEYILRDETRRKEFFSGVLGSWSDDGKFLPGEKPDEKELADNRAKIGYVDNREEYLKSMELLDGIGHDIGSILSKTRTLAENNPNYPDFAKIHLALKAIFREVAYQRHVLGD